MSQLAVCLVEFLAFLGIPYLKQLQRFIALAILQLRAAEEEIISQLVLTKAASEAVNTAIGVAQLVANEVENTLGGLPLGAFQDCVAAAEMVGTLRDSFATVLDYFDEITNQANRIRAFADVQGFLLPLIDEQIAYLENLNSEIDVIILDELKKQANDL